MMDLCDPNIHARAHNCKQGMTTRVAEIKDQRKEKRGAS